MKLNYKNENYDNGNGNYGKRKKKFGDFFIVLVILVGIGIFIYLTFLRKEKDPCEDVECEANKVCSHGVCVCEWGGSCIKDIPIEIVNGTGEGGEMDIANVDEIKPIFATIVSDSRADPVFIDFYKYQLKIKYENEALNKNDSNFLDEDMLDTIFVRISEEESETIFTECNKEICNILNNPDLKEECEGAPYNYCIYPLREYLAKIIEKSDWTCCEKNKSCIDGICSTCASNVRCPQVFSLDICIDDNCKNEENWQIYGAGDDECKPVEINPNENYTLKYHKMGLDIGETSTTCLTKDDLQKFTHPDGQSIIKKIQDEIKKDTFYTCCKDGEECKTGGFCCPKGSVTNTSKGFLCSSCCKYGDACGKADLDDSSSGTIACQKINCANLDDSNSEVAPCEDTCCKKNTVCTDNCEFSYKDNSGNLISLQSDPTCAGNLEINGNNMGLSYQVGENKPFNCLDDTGAKNLTVPWQTSQKAQDNNTTTDVSLDSELKHLNEKYHFYCNENSKKWCKPLGGCPYIFKGEYVPANYEKDIDKNILSLVGDKNIGFNVKDEGIFWENTFTDWATNEENIKNFNVENCEKFVEKEKNFAPFGACTGSEEDMCCTKAVNHFKNVDILPWSAKPRMSGAAFLYGGDQQYQINNRDMQFLSLNPDHYIDAQSVKNLASRYCQDKFQKSDLSCGINNAPKNLPIWTGLGYAALAPLFVTDPFAPFIFGSTCVYGNDKSTGCEDALFENQESNSPLQKLPESAPLLDKCWGYPCRDIPINTYGKLATPGSFADIARKNFHCNWGWKQENAQGRIDPKEECKSDCKCTQCEPNKLINAISWLDVGDDKICKYKNNKECENDLPQSFNEKAGII